MIPVAGPDETEIDSLVRGRPLASVEARGERREHRRRNAVVAEADADRRENIGALLHGDDDLKVARGAVANLRGDGNRDVRVQDGTGWQLDGARNSLRCLREKCVCGADNRRRVSVSAKDRNRQVGKGRHAVGIGLDTDRAGREAVEGDGCVRAWVAYHVSHGVGWREEHVDTSARRGECNGGNNGGVPNDDGEGYVAAEPTRCVDDVDDVGAEGLQGYNNGGTSGGEGVSENSDRLRREHIDQANKGKRRTGDVEGCDGDAGVLACG